MDSFFGLSLTFCFFILGSLLYNNERNSLTSLKPEPSVFSCTISDYPEEKANSFMMTVKLHGKLEGTSSEPVHGSMVLYLKKDKSDRSFLPGDKLIIKCTPAELTNRGNPHEFDYKFYMQNLGIRYFAFAGGRDIVNHTIPQKRKIIHRALIVRESIIEMYKKRGVSEERLPLVAAITLGEKSMLGQEQKQNFIKAGIMHIMAVSGLHAVVLSLFVFNLLFFLKRKFNILRIIITIIFLWSFAFVTGLTPSVLRATLMFTFLQAGTLMQRRVNGINSVLASAFVLILIRPSVIFDAGFLLSYSAVTYIIIFYQEFYLKLHLKSPPLNWTWQSAVITIVAQAGTLPLTIMLFNRFPTYFILTNIIIVPLSSLVIITGCLIPVLFPLEFLSGFLGKVLDYLTGLTELLTAKAASLPGSNIENIGMTIPECMLLIVTVFFITSFILRKKPLSVFYPVLLIILLITADTITEISVRTTSELIVYNTQGSPTIGLRTGKILRVYSDTLVLKPEVVKHCATLGLKPEIILMKDDNYFLKAGGKNILICKKLKEVILKKYPGEIVIFTGYNSQVEDNVRFPKNPQVFIITSASGFSGHPHLSASDTIHFIRNKGAYAVRL